MFYPVTGDPFRSNVSLHLPMTGANNSTTFTDVSPSPKTITRVGDTKILTAQSKWGQGSGYFDGTGDYLQVANSADFDFGAGNFTIEFWIKTTTTTANLVSKRLTFDFTPFSIFVLNGKLLFRGAVNTTGWSFSITSTDSINTDNWVHSACVRNGNEFASYIMGIKQSETASAAITVMTNTAAVYVAANSDASSPLTGYLQDLRITKGVARYTANFTPPAGPLAARLPELPVRRSIIQPTFNQVARLGL
jgi:hypothetical protein